MAARLGNVLFVASLLVAAIFFALILNSGPLNPEELIAFAAVSVAIVLIGLGLKYTLDGSQS